MHFPWEAGINACCRLGSSALDSKHSAETLLCWICGATENHWRGESLSWTWCKARNMLRVVGLCWRTWGLNIHLICSPLYQPKAGEITTLLEWFCTSTKEQMGPHQHAPPVGDTGTLVQPILPSPPHSHSPAPGPKPLHCSHTCWHHCWLSHCANKISEQNRN